MVSTTTTIEAAIAALDRAAKLLTESANHHSRERALDRLLEAIRDEDEDLVHDIANSIRHDGWRDRQHLVDRLIEAVEIGRMDNAQRIGRALREGRSDV